MEKTVDPLKNLILLFQKIIGSLLISFPYAVALIFAIFIIILAFFGLLFPSFSTSP